jgi:hypothetical protein
MCLLSDGRKNSSPQSAFLIFCLWLWQVIYTGGKIATFFPLTFCLLCKVYAFASAVSHSVAVVAALNLSVLTLLVGQYLAYKQFDGFLVELDLLVTSVAESIRQLETSGGRGSDGEGFPVGGSQLRSGVSVFV